MAKRRGKTRRKSNGFKLPVAVVAGFVPGIARTFTHFRNPSLHGSSNGIEAAGVEASRIYLGYDPRDGDWNPALLSMGTVPLILGMLVHKFVGGRLGVNRALASAGIPIIRL